MSIARKEIEDFFSAYAKALSTRDIQGIVKCWGIPTLVLSDEGVIAVSKFEEVEAFFASSIRQYETVTSAHSTLKFMLPMSDNVVGCQIVWDHLDDNGKSVGGEVAYYLLKRDDKALHIHVYTPMTIT